MGKTQGMLDKLDGEFDMIKKTNFTHPKVDFEDKYTPFLLKLREKYEQREKNVTEIDIDFHKNKEEFTSLAKTFLENSAKIITLFKDALVTLKEFSTAKTLKNPSSIEESFNEFKDQKFPLLTNGTFVEDCFDTYMSFKKFCVQDLLGKQCVVLTNKTEATTSFKNKFAKLKDYNLKNSSRVYAEDIYAVTLNVMNIFMTASDIISNANLNSNFNGVTKEYLGELQAMNAYLKNKKAVKISDFDHLDKNGANVTNFERDFRNLIQSTKFICFNVQVPFFLNRPAYNPKPDIENEKKEDKLKRIITEFDKQSNEQNIFFDDDQDYNATMSDNKPSYEDNLDMFDKPRHLDCMKKTNYDKILLKSPCFNDLNEKEKKVVNQDPKLKVVTPIVKPTKNEIEPTKNDTITPTNNNTDNGGDNDDNNNFGGDKNETNNGGNKNETNNGGDNNGGNGDDDNNDNNDNNGGNGDNTPVVPKKNNTIHVNPNGDENKKNDTIIDDEVIETPIVPKKTDESEGMTDNWDDW